MLKNVKRAISFVLCFALLCSTLGFGSSATDGAYNHVSQIEHFIEKTAGTVISLFARCFNMLTGKNESDIPYAPEFIPAYKEYTGSDFVTEVEQTVSAETWVAIELEFTSEKAYADPFNDTDIDLQLYGNGKLYTVPGFWDGGNTWKVRFVCPEAGEWFYKTVCTDAENTALHNRTGKVICTQYSGDLNIYKHGFVTTSAGKKYFTYADGTPFFYLGDTHWSLGDETVDMVQTICDKRVAQGFTVFQSEPIGATFDMTNGITEADMAGLEINDEKFRIIAESGLVHANAQFFFPAYMQVLISNNGGYSDKTVTGVLDDETVEMHELSDSAKAYLEKLSRYWVARYGAYPVMWTLGQEVDRGFYWNETSHPDWNFINNPYRLVAEYIAKYDAYSHPLTAHQENSGGLTAYGDGENTDEKLTVYHKRGKASCFRDIKAHTFYAAQWSPDKTGQSDFVREKDLWFNSQGKPSINYEGQYCYLWTKNFGARMQGWTSYLSGMYGYGWGGHDTWSYLNIFDEHTDSSDGVDTITSAEKINATWQDSLEYESSYQVGYMRSFFENTEWYNLIPRFDNKAYFMPCLKVYYTFASNADNTEMVIYFYSFTNKSVAQKANTNKSGGFKTGTVGNLLPETEYTYQWFNPIAGEYGEEGSFTSTSLGTYYIGEKPQAIDMVLWIKQAK